MAHLLSIILQIWSFFVCFPQFVVGVTVPSDVTVQQGDTATLICRLGSPITGLALWLEGSAAFADKDQVLPDAPAKYSNFEIVNDDTSIGQMDLRINNAQYEDRGTYICQFGGTPDGSATLEVQVPASSLTIAVNGTAQSPDATVIVTAGTQVTLVCTSLGAKPKVTLDWFKGSEPLGPDTETIPSGGEATDTQSTIDSFIPTRADDQNRIECRTVGHISSQSQYITLNVYFAPVVTSLRYSNGMITCEADANPITNIEYYIILNGTKPSLPTGKTLAFDVDKNYCTQVSCSVTNSVGTGSKELEEPLCPGYVEPTTTPATKSTPPTKPPPAGQGLGTGAIIGIAVGVLVVVCIVIIGIIICYKKKIFCFDNNKTSNSSTSPKKQPSAKNADMIRNQPEVRQSVHNYDDEPKKPRVPRSNSGKPAAAAAAVPPEKEALRQNPPPHSKDRDHLNYPMDSRDGGPEHGGQAGLNYADLEFQNRQGATNGHGGVHPREDEPTQYASILV